MRYTLLMLIVLFASGCEIQRSVDSTYGLYDCSNRYSEAKLLFHSESIVYMQEFGGTEKAEVLNILTGNKYIIHENSGWDCTDSTGKTIKTS